MLTPWIKINGQPMILIDVFSRHFVFFGITFFSHDAPFLFFLLIILILAIFTVTALFGRLWCGWTCPQSVFLHALFNRIERLLLGRSLKRQLLLKSEDSPLKKLKIFSVYFVFAIICWLLAHSFVAYFLGSEAVTKYIIEGPALHLNAFISLTLMSVFLFLNFGFFREKLCFVICPYGRFQNALIDSNSLVVFYDALRGEPRARLSAKQQTFDSGDCIDCQLCVKVCPTKIDIRKGFQFECIACGMCIDACNNVMSKIKKQPNLIRYETGDQKKIDFKRFRLVLYSSLVLVFTIAFVYSLEHRSPFDFYVTRGHLAPFVVRQEIGKKVLTNQLQLSIRNQTDTVQKIQLKLSDRNQTEGYRLLTPALSTELSVGQDLKLPGSIEIDEERFTHSSPQLEFILSSENNSLKRQILFIKVQ